MNEENTFKNEEEYLHFKYSAPCHATCPACGSDSAKREFDPWGQEFRKNESRLRCINYDLHLAKDYNKKEIIEPLQKQLAEAKAILDATPCVPRIKNTCLCCGYTYDTKPLNAQ